MMKKIACFAVALALVAGSALAQKPQQAQKPRQEKDSELREDRKEVRKDRMLTSEDRRDERGAEMRADKKIGAPALAAPKAKEPRERPE